MKNELEIIQSRSLPIVFKLAETGYSDPENDMEFVNGTYFLVEFENRFYIVSAVHNISDYPENSLRFTDKEFNCEPFHIGHRYSVESPEDEDHEDLLILEILMEKAEPNHAANIEERAYKLPPKELELTNNDTLYIIGCPKKLSKDAPAIESDPNEKTISLVRATLECNYIYSNDQDQLKQVHLTEACSLGGMSGSPVYKYDLNSSNFIIAGILLRGGNSSSPSAYAHFLHVRVLYNALKQI